MGVSSLLPSGDRTYVVGSAARALHLLSYLASQHGLPIEAVSFQQNKQLPSNFTSFPPREAGQRDSIGHFTLGMVTLRLSRVPPRPPTPAASFHGAITPWICRDNED